MKFALSFAITAVLSGFTLAAPLAVAKKGAMPTKVMVRAVSRDAKIIGTNVGGAKITIRDVSTGRTLAEGLQMGSTGDTERIIKKPRKRGVSVYDTKGAAGFLATMMLSEPTVVEVIAEGPLGTPQSTQRASKTLLLVPGEHILGDGILLEIHGFTVEILVPVDRERIERGEDLHIRARVTMT